MADPCSITVLLATHQRAGVLEEALEAFCRLDRSGLDVEFVVVDSASSDGTGDVLQSFRGRLPLRLLREDRPGKCRALNRALDEAPLRETVVFTDDDVTPVIGWLQEVRASLARWPGCTVFGGRIRPAWPRGRRLPAWTRDVAVRGICYAEHDHGEHDRPYPPRVFPIGPNFWLRRRALGARIRFDESIGAHPTRRTTGEEIDFLQRLHAAGNAMAYVPAAEVAHRIQPQALSLGWLARRGVHYGRGHARTGELCHRELLESRPALWFSRRCLAMAWQALRLGGSALLPARRARVARSVDALAWLTYNVEMVRRALERR